MPPSIPDPNQSIIKKLIISESVRRINPNPNITNQRSKLLSRLNSLNISEIINQLRILKTTPDRAREQISASASMTNNSSYSWTKPSTQTVGSDYKIRITRTSNTSITDSIDNLK